MTPLELPDDAERMVPDLHRGNVMYAEHVVRYLAAAEYVHGKVVLDVACGSGYGTELLAKGARRVYGVDVSRETVAYAQERYGQVNVFYCCGDAHCLPLADHSVEVVVSFETIEHLSDHTQFLQEVKRVLAPGGVCIVSTPNIKEFASGNEYHIHEFAYDEFEAALRKEFAHVLPAYQGTWVTSALLDEPALAGGDDSGVELLNFSPAVPEQSIYFVVICSDNEIDKRLSRLGALGEPWSAQKLALTDQHISNITDQRDAMARTIKDLEQTVENLDEGFTYQSSLAAQLSSQLEEITSSRGWAWITRFRKLRERLRRFGHPLPG